MMKMKIQRYTKTIPPLSKHGVRRIAGYALRCVMVLLVMGPGIVIMLLTGIITFPFVFVDWLGKRRKIVKNRSFHR